MNKVTEFSLIGEMFAGMLYFKQIDIEFQVTGEFDVKMVKGYPEISNIVLYIEGNRVNSTSHSQVIDFQDLEQQILAADDGTWSADHEEAIMMRRDERAGDR